LRVHLSDILLPVLTAALFLIGCPAKETPQAYGSYNIGVCSTTKLFVTAATVSFTAEQFSIIAEADGPNLAHAVVPNWVFSFVTEKNGQRVYKTQINGHEDQVIVSTKDGILSGDFLIEGEVKAHLHGKQGTPETLGADGAPEYTYCTGEPAS
jgi:hypothetical protein